MTVKSNAFDFERVMKTMLHQYEYSALETIQQTIPQVAKEACKKLRQTSPRKSGDYAKNWKWRNEKGKARYVVAATVYGGKPTYRLAHLLEHGHAKRGGGRNVPAIEHIRPVAEWANDEVIERVLQRLEKEMRP